MTGTGATTHQHVFVGGLHRSGTTLVTKCIAAHPRISSFSETGVYEDEGQFLQTVFNPAGDHGGPGRFAFDPDARLAEESALVTDENRRQLLAEWGRYWELDRPILIEKSPPNIIRARFLQALFPGALFVMVVRHPVAVAYATHKWTPSPLSELIRHWLAAHRQLAIDQSRLGRLIVVRYEDFIREPQPILDRIHESLGLAPQPLEMTVNRDGNLAYFARWRRNWPPAWLLERARLIRRFETDVSSFGYSLRKLDRPGAWPGAGEVYIAPQ